MVFVFFLGGGVHDVHLNTTLSFIFFWAASQENTVMTVEKGLKFELFADGLLMLALTVTQNDACLIIQCKYKKKK